MGPEAGQPVIRFDLDLVRGSFPVRASLESEAKVTGLMGSTGSGKTTVLLGLAGLLRPLRGKAEVGGAVLFDSSRGIRVRPEARRVGFVFQDDRLFPHLDVRENLLFSRPDPQDPGPRLEEIVHLLDLEPLLRRRPRELSGGQARLVAVGRALLTRPRLLLLDEPLTGLDAGLRRRVLAYLLRLKESLDVRMLLVSHVLADVLALADEIAVLHEGEIVARGEPARVLPRALAETGAGMVETTLTGVVRDGGDDLAEVECQGARLLLPLPEAKKGDSATVTVGAEEVLLAAGHLPRTSARNTLTGRVEQMVEAGSTTLVAVNVGPVIWAQVTAASVQGLALAPEREIHLLIKASALRGVALRS